MVGLCLVINDLGIGERNGNHSFLFIFEVEIYVGSLESGKLS